MPALKLHQVTRLRRAEVPFDVIIRRMEFKYVATDLNRYSALNIHDE